MSHKWSQVIELYINNTPIQYRQIGTDFWNDLVTENFENELFPNFNDPKFEWRPTPKYRKYRLAKLYDVSTRTYYVEVINDEKDTFAIDLESEHNFVKWISPWLDMPHENTD